MAENNDGLNLPPPPPRPDARDQDEGQNIAIDMDEFARGLVEGGARLDARPYPGFAPRINRYGPDLPPRRNRARQEQRRQPPPGAPPAGFARLLINQPRDDLLNILWGDDLQVCLGAYTLALNVSIANMRLNPGNLEISIDVATNLAKRSLIASIIAIRGNNQQRHANNNELFNLKRRVSVLPSDRNTIFSLHNEFNGNPLPPELTTESAVLKLLYTVYGIDITSLGYETHNYMVDQGPGVNDIILSKDITICVSATCIACVKEIKEDNQSVINTRLKNISTFQDTNLTYTDLATIVAATGSLSDDHIGQMMRSLIYLEQNRADSMQDLRSVVVMMMDGYKLTLYKNAKILLRNPTRFLIDSRFTAAVNAFYQTLLDMEGRYGQQALYHQALGDDVRDYYSTRHPHVSTAIYMLMRIQGALTANYKFKKDAGGLNTEIRRLLLQPLNIQHNSTVASVRLLEAHGLSADVTNMYAASQNNREAEIILNQRYHNEVEILPDLNPGAPVIDQNVIIRERREILKRQRDDKRELRRDLYKRRHRERDERDYNNDDF